LKTAQVFSGIAGILSGEQRESDDAGAVPSLNVISRETGELQDMYRRSLAAYWSAQPGELKADECIEDIFAGGDGWGDKEKPYASTPNHHRTAKYSTADSSGSVSESEPLSRTVRGLSGSHRKSQETIRPGDVGAGSPRGVHGRSSLEQQAHHLKAEVERKQLRQGHEVDEFEVREDLRSWRLPT
jgi:hypothetical protein